MNPSSTTWAMDMILAFVCGLGLFLLVLPCLESNPSSPPAVEKKNLKKVRNLHRTTTKKMGISVLVLFTLFLIKKQGCYQRGNVRNRASFS
jgi:hypothetical protein